jgi:hypothetical protein
MHVSFTWGLRVHFPKLIAKEVPERFGAKIFG